MYEFIKIHQLDIMLGLSAACLTIAALLLLTKFLSKRRKWILIFMELTATFLLYCDREAYVFRGGTGQYAHLLVQWSNTLVFFLTSQVVLAFNLYLMDLVQVEGESERIPSRLKFSTVASVMGMLLSILSHYTGLYFYIDANNIYHRGSGFLIAYIIPILCPLIQFTVIVEYRKAFSKWIFMALTMYIFVPIVVGILQIFLYGISIVNMAMVIVSILMYVFAYLDINETVMKAHAIQMSQLQEEKKSMKRLFDETAMAFVRAIEKRDSYSEGHSTRVANYAMQVAKETGKTEEECEEVYYAALLHDVGTIGIPDYILNKTDGLSDEEYKIMKMKPVLSGEILSGIHEYPFLREGVLYSHEHYDGSGYPEGRSGKDIPDIARIIAVADAYDSMTSKKRFHDPLPHPVVREELVLGSGSQFDPEYAEMMIHLMDMEYVKHEEENLAEAEQELTCKEYREHVSVGIPISREEVRIQFYCTDQRENPEEFWAPSIVLFDSYDRRVHTDAKTIDAYQYLEYGEVWFDGHVVTTAARNMVAQATPKNTLEDGVPENRYEIIAGRYDDHIAIRLESVNYHVELIAALTDRSKASYIGLTGEHCLITNIEIKQTGRSYVEEDIQKIVADVNYIDRLESDIPNLQIDQTRSASTEGVEIQDGMKVEFHTMSLPSASLVWHCPYILIFSSDDGKVFGDHYHEYAMVKLNGEISGEEDCAKNHMSMKKTEEFTSWNDWKKANKEGIDVMVQISKRGSKIVVKTTNQGVALENTTTILDDTKKHYVALTGDQVALTDIRIH
ncbi:MAG: HD domain-containing protein [Lachnospiraceae bacterium]|nr:HD domain-containing protein [Lachnospiraceae bacterium]